MSVKVLDQLSLIALYSAMAVYTLAFIAYTLDLARRSAHPELSAKKSPSLRVGFALTVLAWIVEVGAVLFRGLAAGRVPWANMYEFSLTGTACIVLVYLVLVLFARVDLRYLGAFVLGMIVIMLGITVLKFYVPVSPLPPALQSYWLIIHIFVATLGTGFLALGAILSGLQLAQSIRYRYGGSAGRAKPPAGRGEVNAGAVLVKTRAAKTKPRFRVLGFLSTFPSANRLEQLAYRLNIVGFVLWTFTLVAGAIWAEKAWGRYWGWDSKEVWTFIIWVLYAGYIHARATIGWRGNRSAVLSLVGFAAVCFNFGIVNVFFPGLHSYSGL